MRRKIGADLATLCLLLTLITAAGCQDIFEHSRCRKSETVVQAPGNKYEAVIQNWSCKPDSTSGKGLEEGVNVRVRNNQKEGVSEGVFSINDTHQVTARWLDPTHLEIECNDVGKSKIINQLDKSDEVTVSYKLK